MWARWGWGPVALALLCTAPLRAQPPQAVASAIAMLGERPHAGEEAWRGLSAQGLPLIEPHPDDDALARVTFIFKTAPSVSGVRLDSVIAAPYARQPVSDYVKDFTLPLQSIGETGIWWITLDVPREIEAVYSFLVFDGERWQRGPIRTIRGICADPAPRPSCVSTGRPTWRRSGPGRRAVSASRNISIWRVAPWTDVSLCSSTATLMRPLCHPCW